MSKEFEITQPVSTTLKGKSVVELFDAPAEVIEQLARQWRATPEEVLKILLNAAVRYEEDIARKAAAKAAADVSLRSATDKRQERIRTEIMRVLADADIETASRDQSRAEVAERTAYDLLNRLETIRDEGEREEMRARARECFRESVWISAVRDIDALREKGASLNEALGVVAEKLRKEAKKSRKNIPRELWLAYNSTARRLEHQEEHAGLYAEVRDLVRELRSGDPSPDARTMLRKLSRVALGAYVRRGAEDAVLRGYGLQRYAPIVERLAAAYKRAAGYPTDYLGEESLGSAEIFDVNAAEAGGFGGASKKSRPRRDPSGGGEAY